MVVCAVFCYCFVWLNVCFLVCRSDCVAVGVKVCCVAGVVEDSVLLSLEC